jgi:phospholipase/carboxylesterase
MTVRSYRDLTLSYVLSVPSGKADSAEMPLVFVLHGRGADANDLADLAPATDGPSGYRFVFPNAPRAFEPAPGMLFGYTWFDGIPPERNSILDSRTRLLRFIDEALVRYPTPVGKVILSGFSQGGMMSLDAGFRTEQKLAGIVVMSGALYEDDLPPLKPLPVLIIHGTQDDMIPVLAARRARRVLEQRGIEPEYHEFPMGHYVTPESLAVVAEFIRKCVE